MTDQVRDKPRRSGRGRIARTAQPSYNGIAADNQGSLRQGMPEVTPVEIRAAVAHSAQEPTEATQEWLNAAPERRRNLRPSGRGGCQALALPAETPERLAMALAAEKAHGKPFWDLVKERAAAGVTIKQTARELGWPNSSFRRLLAAHGMLKVFSGTYTQVLHTFDGITASSRAHAIRLGLSPSVVQNRLNRGYDIETALLTPAEFAKAKKHQRSGKDELTAGRLVTTQYYGLNDCPACFSAEDWDAWIAFPDLPASFCVDCGPEYEARMAREGRCALVNLPEARQNRIRGLRNE